MTDLRRLQLWIAGSRPRTLPAAVVPVIVGAAAAADADLGAGRGVSWVRTLLALVVALALQVGVNYANDYSDGIRGTDRERVGPIRLVGSGSMRAGAVKRAAFVSFAIAGCAGLVLSALAGWWLVAVGIAAVAAAWFYTGGSNPYGYLGLGEVFVFVFFGVVATVGSAYVQRSEITGLAVVASIPVGLLATALLVTNNLRDIPTDAASGKRTLAVRLGDRRTRVLYTGMVASAVLSPIALAFWWRTAAVVAIAAAVAAVPAARAVWSGASGPALVPVLETTGRVQLVFGALLAAGLWFGS